MPQPTHDRYAPRTADDFFCEIRSAMSRLPDTAQAYGALDRAFHDFIDEHCAQAQTLFGGTFAKTDYLLKTSAAPPALARAVNAARARLSRRHLLSETEAQRSFAHDAAAIAQFVAHVAHTVAPGDLRPKQKDAPTEPQDAAPGQRPLAACLRVIVERCDDHYIYVHAEDDADATPRRVDYVSQNAAYPYDRSYLRRILQPGSQLNLVRPRQVAGDICPELIIYEPDYLVDVSAVARCFTDYTESPLVGLLQRLRPVQQSEAIVLGNLAGQLLDATIHEQGAELSYEDVVRHFYAGNAVQLLTAGTTPQLHADARRQLRHIRKAMHEELPADVPGFDLTQGVVEPSFFCEMLGLQGRMDYLQQDFRVLLEQKSGKGAFPYGQFRTPRQKEEHYVQMLLYMLVVRYNFREQYAHNGHALFAYLLYSKYENSLLGLGFAPELAFRALKLRNRLAAMDLGLTKPHAYDFLATLTPDRLNLKQTSSTLWRTYQRPQLEDLLSPIHLATDLERAYCGRWLTFVTTEHVLAKLGEPSHEASGFAATWNASLEAKRLSGNIHDELLLLSPEATTRGPITAVCLGFAKTPACEMSNFRVGDIVMLYPYKHGSVPDARRQMVQRGTIEAIDADTVTVHLRAPQTDARIFRHDATTRWAMEHDNMEAAFTSQCRGIYAFLLAPQERRELLLLQRPPRVDTTRTLRGDYGSFNDLARRVKQARDFFLIVGPPGTGKTSFGMLYAVREELLEPDGTVLLLSYTNRAVDEMCSKLLEAGINFLRVGNAQLCAPAYQDRLLSEVAARSLNLESLRQTLRQTRVVAATAASMASNLALLQLKQFSLAVIDEASQILEPHLLGLLSYTVGGKPAIGKFVMIGDHKQLPAVVQQSARQSHVSEPALRDIGLTDCAASLFERLLNRYAARPDVTYMLTRQGRMHPDIADFPNRAFYGGRLRSAERRHQCALLPTTGRGRNGLEDLLLTRRVAFLAVTPPDETPSERVNANEAAVIAATALMIYNLEGAAFDARRSLGIIVPYRNQVATVRAAIARAAQGTAAAQALADVAIDTVERFQGSQRRTIIYGFTVRAYAQLRFLTEQTFTDADGSLVDRKLNVAMTRAEERLILVGWPELLGRVTTFARLIAYTKRCGDFFQADAGALAAGRFDVPPRTDEHAPTPDAAR